MPAKRQIRCGLIGLGLMGREFASLAARWCHLTDLPFQPVLTAICDRNEALYPWYTDHFPSIALKTKEHHELLARPDVDVVYCAVPHNLHAQLYTDIIAAGKHLFGEKPFGIDAQANAAIVAAAAAHPNQVVRCCSEFPFYPAVLRILQSIREKRFGRILQVNCGFLHSSDLDPNKPINWKRMIEFNGEYGCLGDLGMHALHLPIRAGWTPKNLRAILTKAISERPDSKGNRVPCKTWDNGTIFGEAVDPNGMGRFPLTVRIERIAPGEMDTWYLEILGTQYSVRFSTKNPKCLESMEYTPGQEQTWRRVDVGFSTLYPTITGAIFEFGFCDSLQQMWATYLAEVAAQLGTPPPKLHDPLFGCVRPDETARHHAILTAALQSEATGQVIAVEPAS
ncbi:MAG: Gfo/Idh/MocA family protein [Planctomycetota bacterium]